MPPLPKTIQYSLDPPQDTPIQEQETAHLMKQDTLILDHPLFLRHLQILTDNHKDNVLPVHTATIVQSDQLQEKVQVPKNKTQIFQTTGLMSPTKNLHSASENQDISEHDQTNTTGRKSQIEFEVKNTKHKVEPQNLERFLHIHRQFRTHHDNILQLFVQEPQISTPRLVPD
jgi:hypothetical protein